MIDVKAAVKGAMGYVADLFKDQGAQSFLLEEVEFDERANSWLVTVSFVRQNSHPNRTLLQLAMPGFERVFKTVVLDADNGNVKALRIRTTV
jgi:hypothetical protein